MVKRYRQFFRSDADGLRISALSICPEEMPYKGVIQLRTRAERPLRG